MSAFDPQKLKQAGEKAEEKADGLLEKLKNLPYTALFLAGAALMILAFIALL